MYLKETALNKVLFISSKIARCMLRILSEKKKETFFNRFPSIQKGRELALS